MGPNKNSFTLYGSGFESGIRQIILGDEIVIDRGRRESREGKCPDSNQFQENDE